MGWGGASGLADAAVHTVGAVGGFASPTPGHCLQAAADGAAFIIVENVAFALHIILQALLLTLELLVPLLQLPLVLRQPMLLCVTVPQVPGYGGDQRQDRVGPRVQVQVQVGLGLGQGAGYG